MIDVKNMTNEQMENFDWDSLSDSDKLNAIRQLDDESNIKKTLEQSNKLVLNSIYGSSANKHFYFYDKRLAETITLQGQDAIKYSENAIQNYFHNIFHKDTELLQKLKDICPTVKLNPEPCTKPMTVYMDTDSVDKDTIITTNKGKIRIGDLYNESDKNAGNTLSGHESVETNTTVLNWNESKGLYYAKVKRVIRHKVTKARWILKTSSGKEVVVTNDHSMVVFRNGTQTVVKPSDIIDSDLVLEYNYTYDNLETCFTNVRSYEYGEFVDEYVYDIEIDDETHTFIANDILVHNSAYVTFEEVAEKINWTGSTTDLVLTINDFRLAKYLKLAFEKYASHYNTTNYLDFELETISKSGIWVKKKKYIQDIVWQDGKFYDSGTYTKTTGLEIIRLTTPPFCRPELVNLVQWIFDNGDRFTQKDITVELLKLKKRFSIANIEDICITTGIGDYEKYVLDDKQTIKVDSGCGTHIRGAAIYNHYINNNPSFESRYERIKTGDKVKWYYAKSTKEELNVFSFKRGAFPKEFAPEIDLDTMFEKTIINPLNNILQAMPHIDKITGSLKIKNKLF